MIYLNINDPNALNYTSLGQLFKKVFHPLGRTEGFGFCFVLFFLICTDGNIQSVGALVLPK